VIQVEQLHKRFGVRTAVEDVSFSAHDGQITGLLGPNGAGKTTTLRMLYALLQPDRGRVTVDGIDAALQPLEVRRRLGVLPDARGLYKRLSARENIAYFARLHGLAPELIRQRSDALIQALAMQDIAERRVEGFSQGERVKTAIARALVHAPGHIVLDEPSNGLDVIATRGLRDFLRQLKSEGRCVLFSTHIMQEVAALCDRIVIIAGGRVVADGTPAALRELAGEQNLEEAFVKLIGSAAVGDLA
jgi:sodium transport system ATP-binding protein